MDSIKDQDFSAADPSSANASLTIPTQASALRKGGFVIIKGHPCKISTMTTSKPGKHGHAKISLEAYDIFTHKKYNDLSPAHANVEVPVVTRREFVLLVIDGEYLSLFDEESRKTKDDLKMPEGEVGKKIERLFKQGKDVFVTVLGAMGMEQVVDYNDTNRT